MYNDKEEALYVKACVIAANEEDSQGDRLSPEDIKRIFTSFNNQDKFEVWHQGEQIQGVTLLENYINKANEPILDREAPVGSWLITMKVDNPEIGESIKRHEFEGVSLSSSVRSSCKLDLPELATYGMIRDMECINPAFISLVGRLGTDEGPSNGYPLEVMDYPTYIQKSNNGGNRLGFMSELKALIGKYDSVDESMTDATVEKSEAPEEIEEAKEDEEPVEVLKEECPEKDKEDETVVEKDSAEVAEAEPATDEEPAAEPEVVDEIADLTSRVEKLEAIVAELTKEEETDEKAEAEEESAEEEPKIQKSAKQIITEEEPQPRKTFNELTGRDSFGRKIRK